MTTWISKASEKQRRGRAGRCRPVRTSLLNHDLECLVIEQLDLDIMCFHSILICPRHKSPYGNYPFFKSMKPQRPF